jgi:hypothetical protein
VKICSSSVITSCVADYCSIVLKIHDSDLVSLWKNFLSILSIGWIKNYVYMMFQNMSLSLGRRLGYVHLDPWEVITYRYC